jgi:hypothetical protein
VRLKSTSPSSFQGLRYHLLHGHSPAPTVDQLRDWNPSLAKKILGRSKTLDTKPVDRGRPFAEQVMGGNMKEVRSRPNVEEKQGIKDDSFSEEEEEERTHRRPNDGQRNASDTRNPSERSDGERGGSETVSETPPVRGPPRARRVSV